MKHIVGRIVRAKDGSRWLEPLEEKSPLRKEPKAAADTLKGPKHLL